MRQAPAADALRRVDQYENWAVIIFTLQLPIVCRIGLRTLVLGAYPGQHASLAVALPILALEAAYGVRLFRHLRTLQGRRGCCGARHTALSDERLRVRLQFLMAKYADHAPYWQFVLWARQLAIIAVDTAFEQYKHTPMVLTQASATVAILVATLALHWHTQPYAHRHQNMLELVLGSGTILAVLTGCAAYVQRARDDAVSVEVLHASLIAMLLGPLFVYGVWLAVHGLGERHIVNPSEMRRVLLSGGGGGESGGCESESGGSGA